MKIKFDTRELDQFSKKLRKQALFNKHMKHLTQEIAKVLHQMIKDKTPVKTGKLKTAWDSKKNLSYKVKKVAGGYQVTLTNDSTTKLGFPYALSVNDGHYSYNQFGGAYEVRNRHVPYWDGKADSTFVYGHFFVDKSVLILENGKRLNMLIEKELEKWFTEVVGG